MVDIEHQPTQSSTIYRTSSTHLHGAFCTVASSSSSSYRSITTIIVIMYMYCLVQPSRSSLLRTKLPLPCFKVVASYEAAPSCRISKLSLRTKLPAAALFQSCRSVRSCLPLPCSKAVAPYRAACRYPVPKLSHSKAVAPYGAVCI